jgi:hypothetical protein
MTWKDDVMMNTKEQFVSLRSHGFITSAFRNKLHRSFSSVQTNAAIASKTLHSVLLILESQCYTLRQQVAWIKAGWNTVSPVAISLLAPFKPSVSTPPASVA